MPASRPRHTLINPNKVIRAIIINSLSLILKTKSKPLFICEAPRPKDVAIPITVVKIAIISIIAARGLLVSTDSPKSELTLKALFLL